MKSTQEQPELLKKAKKHLKALALLPSEHIRLSADGASWCLKGQVENHFQKRLAERRLKDISDLEIKNYLHINHSARAYSNTQERLRRAVAKLEPQVNVRLDCQTVHLDGHVNSWQERWEVEQTVLAIPGIHSVESSLVVNA